MSPTPLTRLADDAYQAIRTINHLTIRGPAVPAPELYEVLGCLKLLGPGLAQALTQLSDALERSLEHYQAYEDDGTDPRANADRCATHLHHAARHAAHLHTALEEAQTVISGQGYHPVEPLHPRRQEPPTATRPGRIR